MSRIDTSERERRVDEITDLLISRIGRRAILGYAQRNWGVSERQADRYLAGARRRILKAAAASHEEQHAKALASYEALYAKQLAAGRYGEARKTMDSIVHLLGLAAPERLALYDFSDLSDTQLAAEVAHELPEFVREASRLAGGDGTTGEGPERAQRGAGFPISRPRSSSSSSPARLRRSSTAGRPGAASPMPC